MSHFLKIAPRLSCRERVSRGGGTRRREATGAPWDMLSRVRGGNPGSPGCCLVREGRAVTATRLAGRPQHSSLPRCSALKTRLSPALPTPQVAGGLKEG